MSDLASRPIGVFDSGIGGLTVVRELFAQLPGESVLYFGDTARVPYGPKSAETVQRYARESTAFLLQRGVKMVVIACNTATAHAGDLLAAELPVPVVGVIEPGARAAARETRTRRIGVVGTAGTVASGAYQAAVHRLLPDAQVFAQPCPLFVPIVEEGWVEHEAARLIARDYLNPLRRTGLDVLILGCTHYPLLRPLLASILGPSITLVDSARETAAEVRRTLETRALLRREAAPPLHAFVASDSPARFREVGRRFLGDRIRQVEQVDVDGYGRAA
ncbi:MAG: glutamate racemase [Gemmatimonadetes bacterium]|nr:glutamate racemase [Gemmatimonadota bacterium]